MGFPQLLIWTTENTEGQSPQTRASSLPAMLPQLVSQQSSVRELLSLLVSDLDSKPKISAYEKEPSPEAPPHQWLCCGSKSTSQQPVPTPALSCTGPRAREEIAPLCGCPQSGSRRHSSVSWASLAGWSQRACFSLAVLFLYNEVLFEPVGARMSLTLREDRDAGLANTLLSGSFYVLYRALDQ